MKYEDVLPHGQGNAISAARLAEIMGFHSTRELRADIARARARGVIICSQPGKYGGYYLPDSRDEIVVYVRTMLAHAKSVAISCQAARKELQKMVDQQELPI